MQADNSKILLLHADDYGMAPGVGKAIRALIAEGLTHDVLIDAARAGSSVLWKSLDYEPLNMSHGERVRLVTKLAHSSVAAVPIANAGGA